MESTYTVRALLDAYMRHSAAVGKHTQESRDERQYVFDLFVALHGESAAAAMKPHHLQDFIESHPTWRSTATKRAKANYIRAAFKWAADGERIERHPFISVRYEEAERRDEFPDDIGATVAALANKPYERAFRWLRLTGCRVGELCRATWDQIDYEAAVWRITLNRKGSARTKRLKVVALVPDAIALLNEIKMLPGIGGTIFLNNRGTPWNRRTLGQHLRRMKKRHGIVTKASLHGLRHRMISAAVAAGAPIKMVAEQAGHASVAVIEKVYYHPSPEAVEEMRRAAALAQPKKAQ